MNVQQYIAVITHINDPYMTPPNVLTEINLVNQHLTDADIEPLITTLNTHPAKAQEIKSLNLAGNSLTNIDLSSLTALERLNLSGNSLSDINVSHLMQLITLNLRENFISAIDVSTLTALEDLDLDYNELITIDVSNLTMLTRLGLDDNYFTAVDVSNLVSLNVLSLALNRLTSINISNLRGLTSLNVSDNQLTTIDVSNLHFLTNLTINGNNLTTATIIMLQAFRRIHEYNNPQIVHDPIPPNSIFTTDILSAHFKPMLAVTPNAILNYFKSFCTVGLLSRLPVDAVNLIGTYLLPLPEITCAIASMNNLQNIFGRLAVLPEVDERLLNMINSYNHNDFNILKRKTISFYYNALKSPTMINLSVREANDRLEAEIKEEILRTLLDLLDTLQNKLVEVEEDQRAQNSRQPKKARRLDLNRL